jgi:(5-formylfuran-3-yl)methyl phosphate synthase
MTQRVPGRPGLLVSVRSAAEAHAALEGGADLIDVKEPLGGPLGMADSGVIQDIVAAVAGRVPVSAALGEWRDRHAVAIPGNLQFLKFGLAGVANERADTAVAALRAFESAAPVLVAYADHRNASSPEPTRLVDLAIDLRFSVFLIDTFAKNGATLLDWVEPVTLRTMRERLSRAGIAMAIAGSLDSAAIQRLQSISPSWFAVRGAACVGGRTGAICADRVRTLKALVCASATER